MERDAQVISHQEEARLTNHDISVLFPSIRRIGEVLLEDSSQLARYPFADPHEEIVTVFRSKL
jgi:hypothetical protein